MALFPFFRNIEGAEALIIGGGKHALEKVERLLPYGPRLHVIAEEICEKLAASEKNVPRITYSCRKFREEDLTETIDFVIVAGDDARENHWIANLCRARRIPVNVVDDQEYCDFIFPSLIARGSLSVGICTNGASPSTGVLLKKKIETQIPDNIEEILDFLQEKRSAIKDVIPDKKKRFAFYYKLSELCMEEDRALTAEEFEELLNELPGDYSPWRI